jgi:predicted AAA+ superfamily ATPase
MVCGLGKFSGERVRQRGSSPKLQVFNNGLKSAHSGSTFEVTRANPELWHYTYESAVGAYLAGEAQAGEFEIFYWRKVSKEVDFVLRRGHKIVTIEVKSGRRPDSLPGVAAFQKVFGKASLDISQ